MYPKINVKNDPESSIVMVLLSNLFIVVVQQVGEGLLFFVFLCIRYFFALYFFETGKQNFLMPKVMSISIWKLMIRDMRDFSK